MKFKRILTAALVLILTLPLLTVSAHPGRTDSSGGHTDSKTGDYHYHHGYPAHAHFDIDGNGTIDCPYDFDDQTSRTSGTSNSSGSYTPGDGSKDGYSEGYEDGYKQGKEEGYSQGKADGIEDGYIDGYKAGKSDVTASIEQLESEKESLQSWIWFIVLTIPIAMLCLYYYMRGKTTDLELKLEKADSELARQLSEKDRSYARQIDALSKKHAAQTKQLSAEVSNLSNRIRANQRFNILDKIAAGEDEVIKLPENIHLKQSFTPVRDTPSPRYPYGSYTVFISPSGTKYHCRHDCVPALKPMHYFDLPMSAPPCSRCVPPSMHPQLRPLWYEQIHQRLDQEFNRRQGGPGTPVHSEAPANLALRAPGKQGVFNSIDN